MVTILWQVGLDQFRKEVLEAGALPPQLLRDISLMRGAWNSSEIFNLSPDSARDGMLMSQSADANEAGLINTSKHDVDVWAHLACTCAAAIVARTSVAMLDRTKIMMQVYGTESFYGTQVTQYCPKGIRFTNPLRQNHTSSTLNPVRFGLTMMQLGGVYDMYKHEGKISYHHRLPLSALLCYTHYIILPRHI